MGKKDEFLRRDPASVKSEQLRAGINKVMVVLLMLIGVWASTQYFAYLVYYTEEWAGRPFYIIRNIPVMKIDYPLYPPWQILLWAARYWHPRFEEIHPYLGRAGYPMVIICSTGVIVYTILTFMRGFLSRAENIYGTARWGTKKDIAEAGLLGKKGGVILGELADAELSASRNPVSNLTSLHLRKASGVLSQPGTYNVLLAAPTRSGKGVSSVIPTLLSYPGSVIALDFKAENFNLTSGFRSKFSKIYRYAPVGDGGHHFNPMMEIRGGMDSFADANLIADILTTPAAGKGKSEGNADHFRIAALEFLTSAIIHCLTSDWADKSLPGVASFLAQVNPEKPDDPQFIYKQMIEGAHCSAEAHRQVVEGAGNQAKRPDKEGASVLSTVNNALAVFKDTRIRENSKDSEFSLGEFESSDVPISLYLTVPNSDRDRIAPLIRMFILLMSRKFSSGETQASDRKLKIPILFILDEFDKLGKYDELHTNMGIHNGYGIHYFLIIQSLHQLTDLYGREHSFLAHCQNTILFAPGEFESAKLISEMIGKKSVKIKNVSNSGSMFSTSLDNMSLSAQEQAVDLINPDEAMKMSLDQMILLSQGRPPYRGKKCVYYEDARFKEKAMTPPAFTSRKELFGMSDEEWEFEKKKRDKKTAHWYDIPPDALLPEEKEETQSAFMTFDEQMRLLKEGNKNQNDSAEAEDEKLKYDEIETSEEEEMIIMDTL
ncbi:MAG: type IV secretory system conjugative DNA transfer family protein [Spirochaetaceae bacterium]|jgi:type IV secretion system protein VirD4|nr:type IV secretory system conjugative DNA transfer family protein [Spirochaetaceae bacterium]